jgi:hypothetical protein
MTNITATGSDLLKTGQKCTGKERGNELMVAKQNAI